MGAVSNGHDEGLHQDISQIEKGTLENGVQICLLNAAGHFINWRK
jgi:hypothetical protein